MRHANPRARHAEIQLEQVLTVERRADLPGNPLKWQVALGNLLAGLGADPAGRRVP